MQITFNIEDSAAIIDAVKAVATSIRKDKTRGRRPVLENVLIEISDGQIKLVATNGYVLTVIELDLPGINTDDAETFHIDGKDLLRALPTGTRNIITLDTETTAAFTIESGDKSTTLAKQEGEYPNWESLMIGSDVPTNGAGYDFTVSPALMSTLFKQAETFRGKKNEAPVTVKASEATMKPIHMSAADSGAASSCQ